MNDIELDNLREFVLKYNSFDDLYNNVLKSIDINKIDVYKQLYLFASSSEEAWNIYRGFRSNETINLYEITYNDIDSIINDLKQYDLSHFKRVIVRLDNKSYKDISKLKNLNIDVFIIVNSDKGLCSIDEFINMRQFFDYFKNEYSNYNLSILEKITLCYDYVKFFLYNEENSDNLTDSRSIAKSLSNGHIVCEGYAKIFCQLLYEFDIDSYLMYVNQNHNENHKHVRPIVYIKDDKYELDDYYLFDPTWDSYKEDIDSEFSTVNYDYFLININDYNLYFEDEDINRISSYKNDNIIDIKINNNTINYKLSDIEFDILLRKVKRVEGYSNEQIDKYLSDTKKQRKRMI